MYILTLLKSFEHFVAEDEGTQCGSEKLISLGVGTILSS
jgi:hypothetical protein